MNTFGIATSTGREMDTAAEVVDEFIIVNGLGDNDTPAFRAALVAAVEAAGDGADINEVLCEVPFC